MSLPSSRRVRRGGPAIPTAAEAGSDPGRALRRGIREAALGRNPVKAHNELSFDCFTLGPDMGPVTCLREVFPMRAGMGNECGAALSTVGVPTLEA